MKADGSPIMGRIAEPTGHSLDLLDLAVVRFAQSVSVIDPALLSLWRAERFI